MKDVKCYILVKTSFFDITDIMLYLKDSNVLQVLGKLRILLHVLALGNSDVYSSELLKHTVILGVNPSTGTSSSAVMKQSRSSNLTCTASPKNK